MRENLYLNLLHYPTTAIFIDDNEHFLKNIELVIDSNIPFKSFQYVEEGLDFLNKKHNIKPFSQRYIKDDADDEFDRLTIDLNIRDIHHEMYFKNRFQEISVVIVDYAMPQLNGLEFCRKLNKNKIKKILLTGEADSDLAVEAFNQGLIDHFISKSTQHLTQAINDTVKLMQKSYFKGISESILNLSEGLKRNLDFLYDNNFSDFFTNFINKNKIVEYYIFDETGSFILINKEGKPSIFAMKSKKALDELYEFAAEFSDAPKEITDSLKTGEKIPFFYSEEDYSTPPERWGNYLHTANKFKGEHDWYYWALIDDIKGYNIKTKKILSYHQFNFD